MTAADLSTLLGNAPLDTARADRLIALLAPAPGARVLDVGCGRGGFLTRLVAATGAEGHGVELDPALVEDARAAAAALPPGARCDFRAADARTLELEPASFDAAVCIGASHAFADGADAFPAALRTLARWLRPGGRLLVGEGFWARPPAPEYLDFLGEPVGVYADHAGNVALAERHGFVALHAAVSSDAEWDEFEWAHRRRFERAAAEHPGDPEHAARLARCRAWNAAYLRWGRGTMGFGFYMLVAAPADDRRPA